MRSSHELQLRSAWVLFNNQSLKHQIATLPGTGELDVVAQGCLGPRSVSSQAGTCNAKRLFAGGTSKRVFAAFGRAQLSHLWVFVLLFYVSLHRLFSPGPCCLQQKRVHFAATSQGKACSNQNCFQQLSVRRDRRMAPWRTRACVPSVAAFPPAEHSLLELHTQPQGLFLLHPRAARRFFRLSTCCFQGDHWSQISNIARAAYPLAIFSSFWKNMSASPILL